MLPGLLHVPLEHRPHDDRSRTHVNAKHSRGTETERFVYSPKRPLYSSYWLFYLSNFVVPRPVPTQQAQPRRTSTGFSIVPSHVMAGKHRSLPWNALFHIFLQYSLTMLRQGPVKLLCPDAHPACSPLPGQKYPFANMACPSFVDLACGVTIFSRQAGLATTRIKLQCPITKLADRACDSAKST